MFKFKTFLLSLIGVTAIICGSAFSYFIFDEEVSSSQVIEDKIKVDNIEENYVFGRDDYQGKDYTIYLFPSTLYLEIYQDYLDDPSNNVLPEEAFGYIEAVTHSDGSIRYEITDDSKTGYSGNSTYEDYVNKNLEYLDNDIRRVAQKGLGLIEQRRAEVYGYQIVYDLEINGIGKSGLNGGQNARSDFGEKDDSNGKGVIATNSSWEDDYIDQLDGFEGTEFNHINFNTSQYNNRRHFKNDRFGFWPNLNYDEGRVLPQKIEVFESISQSVFAKETMTPWTSMGDQNGWYDLNFAMWTYIDLTYTGNKITSYSLPFEVSEKQKIELEAFKTKDVINYFDINKSLSGYADKDGIIRLFPSFSNSKGYVENYNGGRDALRMDITEAGVKNRYPMLYFATSKPAGDRVAGINNTNICFVPNIEINSNITDINISIHPAATPKEWPKGHFGWAELYNSTERTALIKYIREKYGDGLYNFYLVIGKNTQNYDSSPTNNDKFSSATDVSNQITSETGNIFVELVNKRLNQTAATDDERLKVLNYTFDDDGHYIHRTYVLMVEKIAEASFYKELNSTYENEEAIKNHTSSQTNAPKFYNLSEKLYKASLNASGAYDVDANSELTAKNSYIYLAQNIDLTESNKDLVMQIRFNYEYYDADVGLYNLNPLSDGEALIFNPKVDSSGNFKFNDDAVFTNASERFKTSSIKITSSGETQNALTLTNFENNQGIYDIIIEYNKTSGKFNVYTYRHTNIFIKLFEKKVEIDKDTGLAIHKKADGTDFDYLLWRKKYYLGVNMKLSDTCDISFNSTQITFQAAVESFINSNSSKGYTKQNLLIRDFVTDALIGYFDNTGNLVLNLRVMKNYILYFDKIGS